MAEANHPVRENNVSNELSSLEKEVLMHLKEYLDFIERMSREPSRIKIDLNHVSKKIASQLNNRYSRVVEKGESFTEAIREIMSKNMNDFNYEGNGRPYTFQLTDVGVEEVSERDWVSYARKQLRELGFR